MENEKWFEDARTEAGGLLDEEHDRIRRLQEANISRMFEPVGEGISDRFVFCNAHYPEGINLRARDPLVCPHPDCQKNAPGRRVTLFGGDGENITERARLRDREPDPRAVDRFVESVRAREAAEMAAALGNTVDPVQEGLHADSPPARAGTRMGTSAPVILGADGDVVVRVPLQDAVEPLQAEGGPAVSNRVAGGRLVGAGGSNPWNDVFGFDVEDLRRAAGDGS